MATPKIISVPRYTPYEHLVWWRDRNYGIYPRMETSKMQLFIQTETFWNQLENVATHGAWLGDTATHRHTFACCRRRHRPSLNSRAPSDGTLFIQAVQMKCSASRSPLKCCSLIVCNFQGRPLDAQIHTQPVPLPLCLSVPRYRHNDVNDKSWAHVKNLSWNIWAVNSLPSESMYVAMHRTEQLLFVGFVSKISYQILLQMCWF